MTKFKIPQLPLTNKKFLIVAGVFLFLIFLFLAKSLFVAAIVNGTPISRLAVVRQLEKQGGTEALNTFIERTLIFGEAKKQGVSVSKEVIDSQLTSIEELLKGQGLTLDEALEARGQTRSELTEQIRIQQTVEAILAQKINITEEDITNYFEENRELLDEGATLEDVKEDIRDQLSQQKLNAEYQTWIGELKAKAKIFYFVNFP